MPGWEVMQCPEALMSTLFTDGKGLGVERIRPRPDAPGLARVGFGRLEQSVPVLMARSAYRP